MDTFDPVGSWRWPLAVVLLASNVAVWIGVYWERESFPEETKNAGRALLLRGLAAETAAAFFLFVIDTTIQTNSDMRVESLRATNLKLEAQIQPRRLSGGNREKILNALQPTPSLPVVVVSRLFDPEGADFADDLKDALLAGGWGNVSGNVNWTRTDKGIFIAVVSGTTIPETAALATALDAANIKHEPMTISGDDVHRLSPWFQAGTLYLIVGAKP